jgi:hypothetical protein
MLELRTRISRVSLDGREYRVIRPDRPAPRMVLHDGDHAYHGYADLVAVKQLATLWALAAASARSIVYVPLRQNTSPYPDHGRRMDMVLSHAALQLRPSKWKALRARLGDGAPHTVGVPDPGDDNSAVDYLSHYFRKYRDLLNFDNASETMFVTGGRESFHRAAVDLRSLMSGAIGHQRADHLCVELNVGTWGSGRRTRHNTPGLVHLQYQPDDW